MRFLLDTNVVSELRKGSACAPAVAAWAGTVESADLGMSVLVPGEIRRGIEVLRRRGDRRQAEIFAMWLAGLEAEFADRLLPVSLAIAERWGELRGASPLPPIDGLMLATALEHDLTLATRDMAPLAGMGARIVNLWDN